MAAQTLIVLVAATLIIGGGFIFLQDVLKFRRQMTRLRAFDAVLDADAEDYLERSRGLRETRGPKTSIPKEQPVKWERPLAPDPSSISVQRSFVPALDESQDVREPTGDPAVHKS